MGMPACARQSLELRPHALGCAAFAVEQTGFRYKQNGGHKHLHNTPSRTHLAGQGFKKNAAG
jgi:hypothetical protein